MIRIACAAVLILLSAPLSPTDNLLAEPTKPTETPHASKTHGAIQVNGDPDAGGSFRVTQNGKDVSLPQAVPGSVELLPGTYEVWVNLTKRVVKVEVGKKSVLDTGILIVEAQRGIGYLPYQGKDCAVNGAVALRSPVVLFPGTYSVFLVLAKQPDGSYTDELVADNAKVVAGKKTVLKK